MRARQRTFHGAYSRTALGSLGYGLTILRLLDQAYHLSEFPVTYATFILILRGTWVCETIRLLRILWVIPLSYVRFDLAIIYTFSHPRLLLELSIISHTFVIGLSDNILFLQVGLLFVVLGAVLFIIAFFRARHSAHDFADRHKEAQILDSGIKTQGQNGTRIFGRPFVTAGWTVVQVTVAVAVVELGLLGLIIRQVCDFLLCFHSCVMELFFVYLVIGIRFQKILYMYHV